MSCGIYKIENKINRKCYVGQSGNIEERWKSHKKNVKQLDCPLYLSINKYGVENFSFEIIEICPKEELNEKEIYWIKQYNSYFNGYNQTMGGNQYGFPIKISDEELFLIFELLQNSDITQREIAKMFEVGEDTISEINMGKTRICEEIQYPIRNYKKQNFCSICGKPISRWGKSCQTCIGLSQRKVERPSKEELYNLLKKNSFSAVGRMFGVSDNAIRKWCLSYEIPSKSSDYKDPKPIKNKLEIKEIYQYNKQNEFIQKFQKTSDAVEWLITNDGVKAKKDSIKGNIYRVANGERKSAYNYIWKHE